MKSVKVLIFIVMLCLILVNTAAIGLYSLNTTRTTSVEAMLSQAESTGIAYSEYVSNQIDSVRKILETMASDKDLTDPTGDPDAIMEKRIAYCERTGFTDLIIVGSNGITYDGVDLNDREYVRRGLAGEVYISDPLVNKLKGTMMFFMSCPTEYGLLCGAISWDTFCDMLSDVKIGERGIGAILNKNG